MKASDCILFMSKDKRELRYNEREVGFCRTAPADFGLILPDQGIISRTVETFLRLFFSCLLLYEGERSECAVASCKIGCAWHHGTDSARSPRRGGHGESEGARQGCAGLVRFFLRVCSAGVDDYPQLAHTSRDCIGHR